MTLLLGQNVNSYGNDLENQDRFATMARQVNEIDGIRRIRFMTSNPKDFTDDVMAAMAQCERVMPSCHLAMRSAQTRVIRRMNRHYTKEEAIALVRRIRDEVPSAVITTDIIYRFPERPRRIFRIRWTWSGPAGSIPRSHLLFEAPRDACGGDGGSDPGRDQARQA